MKHYFKTVCLLTLFLTCYSIQAQESLPARFKRNTLKVCILPIPARIFFSYEHAFSKHISAGAMASYGGISFTGYSYNIFTRFYFNRFNENGWFLEARAGYAHFNPDVYTSTNSGIAPDDDNIYYDGEHKANITYWSAGISGGYKIVCSKSFFFEFLTGLHAGKATFGKDDNYFAVNGVDFEFGTNDVHNAFTTTGPGLPFHFMINAGFAF